MSIEQNILLTMCSTIEKRIQTLKELQLSISNKKELIKTDTELRKFYTNESICKRNIETNGEMAPPLLLRQYNNTSEDRELLEAQNNLDSEYRNSSIRICTFSIDELKFIIENNLSLITLNGGFPIFCDIDDTIYTLKYFGEKTDTIEISKFFITRFIIEDVIIPLFSPTDISYYTKNQITVYLTI